MFESTDSKVFERKECMWQVEELVGNSSGFLKHPQI
jgi:hypothetical protein